MGVVDESVQGRASEPLRPYVAWYTGYRQAGIAPARHRGLPSPYLTLIVTLDDPLVVAGHPDHRQAPGVYASLLGGLHRAPALITHPGRQSGVQVALSPLGARSLLGLPAGELANIDAPADAVLGRRIESLRAGMVEASDWQQRFALLDAWLTGLIRPDRAVPPEVARAWELLLRSGGAMSAAALADEVGWSGRHLASRFRTEIGLSPKAAARVVRFDRARRVIGDLARRPGPGTDPTLAEIAVTYGYFDQAHLARDFRELAGCAPSRWLAEEFRNVQAAGGAIAEPWSGSRLRSD
ncbi:helix-turn-helix domain-containing protein [Streptomyces sp. NPDC054933]